MAAEAQRGETTAVIGGGPAGSVAALCLRTLGRPVEVFEKARFPRYRVGESLLPGTLSILKRLGVYERVEAAGFTVKRAATFLWGEKREPWTFSFATPKTAPWVFDHGLQVERAEYDRILLDAARDAGACVREDCEATAVSADAEVSFDRETRRYAFAIDASGSRGMVARAQGLRRWDPCFRNIALWTYFRGGKRWSGDLAGNIVSATFDEGWIWLIPLKDDVYSVGVVTGVESAEDVRRLGAEAFFTQAVASCETARGMLAGAERIEGVRVAKDWSYDASALTAGRAFLVGDAACFVDPLFSQGVHLATYSGMLAASAIDRLLDRPAERDAVTRWYEQAYRAAYGRYHQFLRAFYTVNEQPGSRFWSSRRVAGDDRAALEEGAGLLASLWRHSASDLGAGLDEKELALRRLRWASGVLKDLKLAARLRWTGGDVVRTVDSYAIGRESFRLEPRTYLADAEGRARIGHPVTGALVEALEALASEPQPYSALAARLAKGGDGVAPLAWVTRMMEDGLVEAIGPEGEPRRMPHVLRFAGVGGDDDFS